VKISEVVFCQYTTVLEITSNSIYDFISTAMHGKAALIDTLADPLKCLG
jgi:hypothetical protein